MAKIRKRPGGEYVSPLAMGMYGLIVPMGLVILAVLSIWGGFINDGQRQILGIGEDGSPLPYLKAAEVAAKSGDYTLAEKLTEQSPILGASSDLEDLIWPERKIEAEIAELTEEAEQMPSARLYVRLAELEWQLQDTEETQKMLEEAERLEPDGEEIEKMRRLL